MADAVWRPWSVRAANLPEHADNPIHTDAGAVAAGYERALVAGTTVYAYMTHPVMVAWGVDWIAEGEAAVRFTAPVCADDLVVCAAQGDETTGQVEAQVAGKTCATYEVRRHGGPLPDRGGAPLEPVVVVLDDALVGYAGRAGEDLPLCAERGIVHPVVWPTLANRVFREQLVDGSWIHTRSRVVHLGLASPGSVATVSSQVVDRFDTRAGERAVADIVVSVDDEPVAFIEHEAIVRLG